MSERMLLRVGAALPAADADPIEDAGILVDGEVIESIGGFTAVRRAYPLASERDAGKLIAVPGLVDAHSHGRGLSLAEQGVRDGPLELFLAQLTACTTLDAHDDTFVAASDLLATGVTAVQTFFHSAAGVDEYRADVRAVADALDASGIEYELVVGFTDQDEFVPASVDEFPAAAEALCVPDRRLDAVDFLAVYDELAAQGRKVTLGPVAPQWCSDRAWQGIADRARRGARIHTHLLESRAQRSLLQPSPVATLRRFGALNERLSAAHAVWLTDAEIADVAAANATLVHCPGSNRRLVGVSAPVRQWLDTGVTAALGLDSNARADPPDVFDELRAASESSAGSLDARDLLRLATGGGAAALGRGDIGQIAPGLAADIVLLLAPERTGDLARDLVTQATRHDIVEVWARGRLRVEDGRLLQRRAAEAARARLRAALAADADARRRRLTALNALEPWLSEIWHLDAPRVPEPAR